MIEKVVLGWLTAKLAPTPCYMEQPETPPDEFVLIEKVGGGVNDHICRASFAIQSISDSLLGAAELNERVKDAMDSLIEHPDVSRCHLDSDYNFTDKASKKYRYQAVYDLVHF